MSATITVHGWGIRDTTASSDVQIYLVSDRDVLTVKRDDGKIVYESVTQSSAESALASLAVETNYYEEEGWVAVGDCRSFAVPVSKWQAAVDGDDSAADHIHQLWKAAR